MEDIVKSGEYIGVHSEIRREARQQAPDVASKVGADVGAEAIAKGIGQIVHERNKSKDEPLAKICSVCFEWIESIGGKDDKVAAGSQHPESLIYRLAIISHVLDDLVQEDDVDGVVVEGQVLGCAGEKRQATFSAGAYSLPVDVYAVDLGAKLG